MTETEDKLELEEPAAALPAGPSPLARALGGLFDALLMAAVLAAGWWAWDGAGAARHSNPAWAMAEGSAGSEGPVLVMRQGQPWRLGEREIAHDAELAVALKQSPGPARIASDDSVLFAQVLRALDILERQGVRGTTINLNE
ncbi:MAG: hypothetical protein AB7O62_20520 [Pirellulales bacterium]